MDKHDFSSGEELALKNVHSETDTAISNSDAEWLTNLRICKHFKSKVYTSKPRGERQTRDNKLKRINVRVDCRPRTTTTPSKDPQESWSVEWLCPLQITNGGECIFISDCYRNCDTRPRWERLIITILVLVNHDTFIHYNIPSHHKNLPITSQSYIYQNTTYSPQTYKQSHDVNLINDHNRVFFFLFSYFTKIYKNLYDNENDGGGN